MCTHNTRKSSRYTNVDRPRVVLPPSLPSIISFFFDHLCELSTRAVSRRTWIGYGYASSVPFISSSSPSNLCELNYTHTPTEELQVGERGSATVVLSFHLLFFFFFSKHFCGLSIHTPTGEMHVYERGLAWVVLPLSSYFFFFFFSKHFCELSIHTHTQTL
jgi:hypothetical protein